MAAWSLPDRDGIELVEPDLGRLYRQGRSRYRRVVRGKGEEMLAMHEWRKRVKDLRYAAEMLERRDQAGAAPAGRRQTGWGKLLGEDHDLAVLADGSAQAAAGPPKGRWRTPGSARTRKTLLKLIARRRRELRRRALRDGERLYRASPKTFMRRIRAAHRAAPAAQLTPGDSAAAQLTLSDRQRAPALGQRHRRLLARRAPQQGDRDR